jgi:hypothetical protein
LVGEDEGVEEGGERIDVIAVGEDRGVELALDAGEAGGGARVGGGAVDVVARSLAALLVLDAAGPGLGGEFLGLLDASRWRWRARLSSTRAASASASWR